MMRQTSTDTQYNDEKKQGVMLAAVAMSLGTLASRILGFIRDAVILALFPRTVTDAFVVAFKLPNFFRRLLGEGSLAICYIPVYLEQLKAKEGESPAQAQVRASQLTNALYTLLSSISLVICAVCIVFMGPIMDFLVGNQTGYASVPGKLEQTVLFSRIMFTYLYLVTMYAFMMAISNAHRKFFIPGLAPALFNLGVIVFALIPQSLRGSSNEILAWGVIFGGVIQAGIIAQMLWKMGLLPRWRFDFQVPGIKRVLANMLPGMLGIGIFQILTVVNVRFAAQLPEGAQSFIYTADRLLELPQSLIAISLGSALLPAFSSLLADGKKQAMLNTANKYLRVQFFLSLPSAIGLWVLALPIVEMLFMRGAFSQEDAVATASIVGVYSLMLIFSSGSKVLSPGFYAIKNTWVPAVIGAICVGIHILVGWVWVARFGMVGIASATALTSFLNMSLMLLAFRKFIGPIGATRVVVSLFKLLPALAAMTALLYYGYPILVEFVSIRYVAVPLIIVLSIACYFAIALVCRSEEAEEVVSLMRRRARKA